LNSEPSAWPSTGWVLAGVDPIVEGDRDEEHEPGPQAALEHELADAAKRGEDGDRDPGGEASQ
jgi:hypothetical protein